MCMGGGSVILLKTCPRMLLSTNLLPSLNFSPLCSLPECVFAVGNVSETAALSGRYKNHKRTIITTSKLFL